MLESSSQSSSQPGPCFKLLTLCASGSFQSLHHVVGHGFDRTAGWETAPCASLTSKQEISCGPDTKLCKGSSDKAAQHIVQSGHKNNHTDEGVSEVPPELSGSLTAAVSLPLLEGTGG